MEQQAALSEVRSQWRRMGNDFDASWAAIAGSVVGVTESAQRRVARSSAAYVPDVLDDLGRSGDVGPSARMNVGPLVGVTGAGIGLAESFFAAVIVAKIGVSRGLTTPQSLARGENILMGRASLAISDAGRAAERVRLAPTRVTHYQRALTLPSCSRCVVLAGRLYRMEQAFQRHARCDCRHLPSGQMEDGPTGDAQEYFESLSEAEQDRIFTKAGAEAIRNGADINQVVNARRGMYTTTGYDGKQWKFTREGTTRRGSYGSGFRSPRYEGVQQPKTPRRLMPEQIQAIARDKEEYLRLLERYGYFYY